MERESVSSHPESVGGWRKSWRMGKKNYIDSQNRKKIFVGFACLVNDGH